MAFIVLCFCCLIAPYSVQLGYQGFYQLYLYVPGVVVNQQQVTWNIYNADELVVNSTTGFENHGRLFINDYEVVRSIRVTANYNGHTAYQDIEIIRHLPPITPLPPAIVTSEITHNRINLTLGDIDLDYHLLDIQFGIREANDATIAWFPSSDFMGLRANMAHRIYIRTQASNIYQAGTAVYVTTINTLQAPPPSHDFPREYLDYTAIIVGSMVGGTILFGAIGFCIYWFGLKKKPLPFKRKKTA